MRALSLSTIRRSSPSSASREGLVDDGDEKEKSSNMIGSDETVREELERPEDCARDPTTPVYSDRVGGMKTVVNKWVVWT